MSGMANGLGVYLQCTSPKDPAITTLEMKVADQEMQLFAQQKQIETLQLLMERNFPRESETIDR
jgi:hypothetical protein